MLTELQNKRRQIIREITNTTSIRRGQLSEQFFEKPDAQGNIKRYGPYYVWQFFQQGKKVSQRIPKEQLENVRNDLQGFQHFKALLDELVTVSENITVLQAEGSKKKFLK